MNSIRRELDQSVSGEILAWTRHEFCDLAEHAGYPALALEPWWQRNLPGQPHSIMIQSDPKGGRIHWQWNGWTRLRFNKYELNGSSVSFQMEPDETPEVSWVDLPSVFAMEITPVGRDGTEGPRIRVERPSTVPLGQIKVVQLNGGQLRVSMQGVGEKTKHVHLLRAPGIERGSYSHEAVFPLTKGVCDVTIQDHKHFIGAIAVVDPKEKRLLAYANYESEPQRQPTDENEWKTIERALALDDATKSGAKPWTLGWPERTRLRFEHLCSEGTKFLSLSKAAASQLLWECPRGYTRAVVLAALAKIDSAAMIGALEQGSFADIIDQRWPGSKAALLTPAATVAERLYLFRHLQEGIVPELAAWAIGSGPSGMAIARSMLADQRKLEKLIALLPSDLPMKSAGQSLLEMVQRAVISRAPNLEEQLSSFYSAVEREYETSIDSITAEVVKAAQEARVIQWLEQLKSGQGLVPELPTKAERKRLTQRCEGLVKWVGGLSDFPSAACLSKIATGFTFEFADLAALTLLSDGLNLARQCIATTNRGLTEQLNGLLAALAEHLDQAVSFLLEVAFRANLRAAIAAKLRDQQYLADFYQASYRDALARLESAQGRSLREVAEIASSSLACIRNIHDQNERDRKKWESVPSIPGLLPRNRREADFISFDKQSLLALERSLKEQAVAAKGRAGESLVLAAKLTDKSPDYTLRAVNQELERLANASPLKGLQAARADDLPAAGQQEFHWIMTLADRDKATRTAQRAIEGGLSVLQSAALREMGSICSWLTASETDQLKSMLADHMRKKQWAEAALLFSVIEYRNRRLFGGRPPLAHLLWILPEDGIVRMLEQVERKTRNLNQPAEALQNIEQELSQTQAKLREKGGLESVRERLTGALVGRLEEFRAALQAEKIALPGLPDANVSPLSVLGCLRPVWRALGVNSFGQGGPPFDVSGEPASGAELIGRILERFGLVPK